MTETSGIDYGRIHIKQEIVPGSSDTFQLTSSSESTVAPASATPAVPEASHETFINNQYGLVPSPTVLPLDQLTTDGAGVDPIDNIHMNWWNERKMIPTDPSMLYRWADGSSLLRAKAERIYKPSNKQEWRAVYWLLVPSNSSHLEDPKKNHLETGTALNPPSLALRKFRRRQCSFSCLVSRPALVHSTWTPTMHIS
eukprot:Gregarina_sp_Poly_1__1565@NODE_1398_length_4220_cov_58_320732_g545_i1_p2_GENE_NODE_1398_length_4220_cov_58_320732_g545_i1NODE_1398_length_4220_cov_58_320732_g545_i1_p2_ORF_typecomplete_len197_score17_33_NODE_1398_length_4220_cov_58_320732_g545_i111351725